MKKIFTFFCTLVIVLSVSAVPQFGGKRQSEMLKQMDKTQLVQFLRTKKSHQSTHFVRQGQSVSAQPLRMLAKSADQAPDAVVIASCYATFYPEDGAIWYGLYTDDLSKSFYFSILVEEGKHDVELGRTYTLADMEEGEEGSSPNHWEDDEWNSHPYIAATFTKTCGAAYDVHVLATVTDVDGHSFVLKFDEKPVSISSDTIDIAFTDNIPNLEYISDGSWRFRAGGEQFGYSVQLNYYSDNQTSCAGAFKGEDIESSSSVVTEFIKGESEDSEANFYILKDGDITVLDTDSAFLVKGNVFGVLDNIGKVFRLDLIVRKPKAEKQVTITAGNLSIDYFWYEYTYQVKFLASNNVNEVELVLHPDGLAEEMAGTYTIGLGGTRATVRTVDPMDDVESNAFSGSLELNYDNGSITITGSILCLDNTEYTLNLKLTTQRIGDLYYNLYAENKTAEVTYKSYSKYTHNYNEDWTITTADIPASVTYNEVEYSVTSIGDYAFYGCTGLTSVTIPNSVTSIGNRAFYNCSSLTFVTIKAETPPTLGSNALTSTNNCPIYIPCGTLDSYKSAWSSYNSRIKYLPLDYTISGKVNMEDAGIVDIPLYALCDTIITAIPNYGYHFVQWSDGVKDNPRKIELTQDTTFTAEFAFDRSGKCGNDSLLTWTYNPEQKLLTISGDGAFDENMAYGAEAPKEMNRLIIENGVTSIGFAAFRNCSVLESVSIPSSVSTIGAYAFSGTKLTQISLANTIQQVGSKAFANCPLEKIHWDIPAQSEMVNEGITVRLDASNLGWSKVNLYAWLDDYTQLLGSWPGTRLQAEANGFYSYTFPAEYNQINIIWNNGSSQTADIEDVTESTIYKLTGSTGTKIGWNSEELKASSPFYQCGETVTEFTLGNSVTSIPIGLCADFVKVERIDIPSSVTSIGAEAFKNCTSLKTLSLGENISSYGNEVFSGCSALDEIYNYRERPAKLGTDAFAGVDYFESTLYVLANSVDMYKSAGSDWKIFYFIEPIGASTVTTDSVSVIPSNNSVLMTWPTNDNAASYTIQITKDGVVFCRLVFNASGQLTGIAFAPSPNGTPRHVPTALMTANGLQFTVTGLNSGTNYGYSVTTKDANDQPIASYSGEFSTTGEVPTSVDQVPSDQVQCTKILRNGQIYILRGDKTYTITGQVVK